MSHLADYPNRQARAGERLAKDHAFGQSKRQARFARLVLEQILERLHQLHSHVFGQPAHVVMRLDFGGHFTARRLAFDDVRVQRALSEKVRAAQPRRLFLEDRYELRADYLALRFRVGHALERGQKALGFVHVLQPHGHLALEGVADALGFSMSKQPVVHEYAGEPVADCAVYERGGDGGIHAAGQRAYDAAFVAHLPAYGLDRLGDEVAGRPAAGASAHVHQEVADEALARVGVDDFRVKLDAEPPSRRIAERGDGRIVRPGKRGKAGGKVGDVIRVAHPDAGGGGDFPKDGRIRPDELQRGATVFLAGRGRDRSAELMNHRLHPVADSQNGDAGVENPFGRERRAVLIDARRPAGEYDAARVEPRDRLPSRGRVYELAIDVRLPHPARD